MILGFKKQFPDKIMAGTKKHTIREDVPNRWQSLMKIHMGTGVRTKHYKCFKEAVCTGVQKIKITHGHGQVFVSIDDVFFYNSTERTGSVMDLKMLELAMNDGFNSVEEFFDWFRFDFEGKIIHWTDLRY